MNEWSEIDFAKETDIGLDSLNWPSGVSPELIEQLTVNLESKKIRNVVIDQMNDEWSGFRAVGYSLRSPNMILATAAYHAYFIGPMEQATEAAISQEYRQRIVKTSNRTVRQLKGKFGLNNPRSETLETLEATMPLINEDPTGFSTAEFLEDRCKRDFGEKSPVFFGVKTAKARYKELYTALADSAISTP